MAEVETPDRRDHNDELCPEAGSGWPTLLLSTFEEPADVKMAAKLSLNCVLHSE
jgi:hypothetical protein